MSHRRRWSSSFALVAAVHLALGVGLLKAGSGPEPRVGEGAPMVVELAAFVGAPPSGGPVSEPIPEPATEPEPEPVPAIAEVEPEPEPEPQPEPAVAEPEPVPERTPDPKQPPTVADNPGVEQDSSAPVQENLQAPIQGLEQAVRVASARTSWQGRVNAHLERHKRYPHAARSRREQGEARVRFSMDRRGRVIEADLDQSSGYFLLDREVQAVVRRAQPLPEPPDDVPGEVLEMVWRVQFEIR
ncbi:energy transducer TonB [Marinimicrobium alkaliphilum]|uniref:energy transducer TonB n=1 Tax=Marinimicrobium alkaliphilum TaxID=2202654 RepID=UPI000DB94856|nr:energy transducer TonB [Marinimicrobium alkaliphilum]